MATNSRKISNEAHLTGLVDELLECILCQSSLDYRDVVHLSATCRRMHRITRSNVVWSAKWLQRWPTLRDNSGNINDNGRNNNDNSKNDDNNDKAVNSDNHHNEKHDNDNIEDKDNDRNDTNAFKEAFLLERFVELNFLPAQAYFENVNVVLSSIYYHLCTNLLKPSCSYI